MNYLYIGLWRIHLANLTLLLHLTAKHSILKIYCAKELVMASEEGSKF